MTVNWKVAGKFQTFLVRIVETFYLMLRLELKQICRLDIMFISYENNKKANIRF